MVVRENHSLQALNTFGVEVSTRWFASIQSVAELQELIADPRWRDMPWLILGGGSNILFTQDYDGLVVHNAVKGIDVVRENEEAVWLRAAGGEVWHELVMYAVEQGWGGIENLSLIPGCVGAAPIQNIGAYGVEVADTLDSVEAVHLETGAPRTFSNTECQFGYRDSIFKAAWQNRLVVTGITLKLTKRPKVNTTYGAIKETLEVMGVASPTIRDVSNAVIAIRRSKLPDPTEIGNAGSFFKNPVITTAHFERIKSQYPNVPSYPQEDDTVKVPAGWLIEQAGWKGKRVGHVGMHDRQALVLVNHGGATGEELRHHAATVQRSVEDLFGVILEAEVRMI